MMSNYKSMMDHQKVIESIFIIKKKFFLHTIKILTAIEEGHRRSKINDRQIFESKCGII